MNLERFRSLWNRRGRDGDTQAEPVFNDLVRRYSEPHRRYHTVGHIDHCLSRFDMAVSYMDDAEAVEMALWFHDAIYDPRAQDNERRSAELFMQVSEGFFDDDFRKKVYDLILVTVHDGHVGDPDEAFIVDVDLSGFGLPWNEFRDESDTVRQEYAHIPDQKYYAGRIKFLSFLAQGPSFYRTEFFREHYEEHAQSNVRRHLAELRAAGYS